MSGGGENFFDLTGDDDDDGSFAQIEDQSLIQIEISEIDEKLQGVEEQISLLLQQQEELRRIRTGLTERLEATTQSRSVQSETHAHPCVSGKDYSAAASFSWSEKVDDVRKRVFNINKFRPFQIETINATLSREDVILIMPTGGGKSLCFQLPALVEDGITLVISPLISLMQDQVDAMARISVKAALLTASSKKDEMNIVQKALTSRGSSLSMIYVTPERISKSKRFMHYLEKAYELQQLRRIIVDEVHCTSQWGHDFRPDYKKLSIIKHQFPDVPILGLTATATARVLDDVKQILGIPKCIVFKASFNRENLVYEVKPKPSNVKDCMEELKSMISRRFPGQSGIVYCLSRNQAEQVASDLCTGGIKAACYHAEMSPDLRTKVHRQWTKNEIQVVVATIAFGMGIDKQDVRFVIHHTVSKTVENFYQETGRAGRDGQMAHCVLYFRSADAYRLSSMVFNTKNGLQGLYSMLRYSLDGITCRRLLLARHFNESFNPSDCKSCCDHCQTGPSKCPPEQDISELCRHVLTIIRHSQPKKQRLTGLKLSDAWRGIGQPNLRVVSVPTPSLTSEQCESIILYMITECILKEEFHFTAYSTVSYVVAGSQATTVLSKARRVFFRIPGTVQLNRATCIPGDDVSSTKTVRSVVSTRKAPVVTQKAVIQYGDGDESPEPIKRTNSKPVRSSLATAFKSRFVNQRNDDHVEVLMCTSNSEKTASSNDVELESQVSKQGKETDETGNDQETSGAIGHPAKRHRPVLVDLDDEDNDDMSLFDNL